MSGIGLTGKDITLTVGGSTILGVITKDVSLSNAPLETTDDGAQGWRELMASGGLKGLDLSISGTLKNYALLASMFEATQTFTYNIGLGDATNESTLTGQCFLSEFQFSGDSNELVTYSASLLSANKPTFTAGT